MIRLYHATTAARAAEILAAGFRDGEPIACLDGHAGVWLADAPTTQATTQLAHVAAVDHAILAVDVPDEIAARWYIAASPSEIIGRCREFCIPAEVLNGFGVEATG